MITLKHSETGGYVSSQFAYEEDTPEVYLKLDKAAEPDNLIAGE